MVCLFWAFLFLGAGCSHFLSGWSVRHGALQGYYPDTTRVLGSGTGLTGGYVRSEVEDKLEKRRAAIFLVTRDTVLRTYDGPGWILSMDRTGTIVWAIGATLKKEGQGSDYRLLRSEDNGKSWKERGPISALSLIKVLAVGPNEVWALGARTLVRTADGGKTWQAVQAPGERDPYKESLSVQGRSVLLLGQGILATRNGGRTWEKRLWPDVQIVDISGEVLLAKSDSTHRVGVLTHGGVQWLASFEKKMWPFRLVVEGKAIRFLAVPSDAFLGSGMYLYESYDYGKSWRKTFILCRASEGAVDIGPGGSGLAVNVKGELLLPGR
ncbi:MAG: hypothetical protein HYU64_05405 [Armatimonadetes bacterium]|nr:hypothetical protein [Armatimonadota bacterium]